MARDFKDLQIIALKDTIKELNITISALSTTVASSNKREQDFIAREAEYKEQIADMKEQLSNMQLPAVQGLAYIEKLFDLEENIHKKSTSFDAIREERLKRERPVLDAFWKWLDDQTAIKGSRFDKALTYIRNSKPYLEVYLEDGGCSFSNNTSERSCKAFVTGRKAWLFCDSVDGANASSLVYSIVETAKANGVDVYHYLKYLLEMAHSLP